MKNKIKILTILIFQLIISNITNAMEKNYTTTKLNTGEIKILENEEEINTINTLKNIDYDIGPIPKDKELEIEPSKSTPRILYDRKNKKYCYQLKNNTFIFLDEYEYKKNKTLFEIKDDKILFKTMGKIPELTIIGKIPEIKIYGRNSDLSNLFCNKYGKNFINYEEYLKKCGHLDNEGEFKKPINEVTEIKIYDNTENYFNKICRIYKNIDAFKNNNYIIYPDIYDYYFPDRINTKIEKFIADFPPTEYFCKYFLDKTKKNIEKYEKEYKELCEKKYNLIMQKEINTDQVEILKNFLKLDDIYEKDDKFKYHDEPILKTIYLIKKNIISLLTITKYFKYQINDIKKQLPNHPYSNESEIKSIIEVPELKEKLKPILENINKQKSKLFKLFLKFINLYIKIIDEQILLKTKNKNFEKSKSMEECLNKINKLKEKFFKLKTKEIKSIFLSSLNKQIENPSNMMYLYRLQNNEINRIENEINKIENEKIKPAINTYKKIFYSNKTLDLPEKIDELKETDKKKIDLFFKNISSLINKFDSYEDLEILKTKKEYFIKDDHLLYFLNDKDNIDEYILEKQNNIKKKYVEIILNDLTKFLVLYKDFIIKNEKIFPEYKKTDEKQNSISFLSEDNKEDENENSINSLSEDNKEDENENYPDFLYDQEEPIKKINSSKTLLEPVTKEKKTLSKEEKP